MTTRDDFATSYEACDVPGLVTLQVGDVLEVDGDLCVVDYVNDCRARCRPVLGESVMVETIFGKKAVFEAHKASVNVAVHAEPGTVAERLGKDGLEQFLASQTARRRGAVSGANQTTTNDRNERIITMAAKLRALKGEKKTRKPRGGLAADMAADMAADPTGPAAAEAEPKRERKAKSTQATTTATTQLKGRCGDDRLFGYSVSAVIHLLGEKGVKTPHATAIMQARGIDWKQSSIGTILSDGRTGKYGKSAPLTMGQFNELLTSAPDPAK